MFEFTPESNPGAAHPKYQGIKCYGKDLSELNIGDLYDRGAIDLSYILEAASEMAVEGEKFFNDNNFFEKLSGTSKLRIQILAGLSESQIKESWASGLREFKKVRNKYLIYRD